MSVPLVTVRYWAGARRAAGRESEQLAGVDLADVLGQLNQRPELAPVLATSAVLVNAAASKTDQPLQDGAIIDILPPFAGG